MERIDPNLPSLACLDSRTGVTGVRALSTDGRPISSECRASNSALARPSELSDPVTVRATVRRSMVPSPETRHSPSVRAASDFTFFGSVAFENVSLLSSCGIRDIRLNILPRPCFEGESGGSGVGKGTSVSSPWNMERLGCSSLTRLTTPFLELASSSVAVAFAREPGLRKVFNFDNMLD